MLRASAKRPITPNKLEAETNLLHGHWSKAVYESYLTSSDDTFELTIEGGSDNGQFPFIGYVPATNRSVSKGDILLEVQGQKIAGYTQRDVLNLLKHYMRNGNSVQVRAVKSGTFSCLLIFYKYFDTSSFFFIWKCFIINNINVLL